MALLAVATQSHAAEFMVPSAVSCKNTKFELRIENTHSKPGESSAEFSPNEVTLVDLINGGVAEKSELMAAYYSGSKAYLYFGSSNREIMRLKTNRTNQKATVKYLNRDKKVIRFAGCKVHMVHP